MKKLPSKAQLRAAIAAQVDDYLDHGGAITCVRPGDSGVDPGAGPLRPNSLFDGRPKAERTFVPEVIAALDARKQALRGPRRGLRHTRDKTGNKTERKQLVLDDFGEPLRWRWRQD